MTKIDTTALRAPSDNTGWMTDDAVPDPKELPRPAGWRLIVRPLSVPEKSKGGILFIQDTKDALALSMTLGRVLAIGPLCWAKPDMRDPDTGAYMPWAEIGDYVMYGKFAGQKFECEGVRCLTLNDDEVVAVVSNPDVIKR